MIPDILQQSYALNSRMQLKARLMEQRGLYLQPTRKIWLCPVCLQPIHQNQRMDLHEALLSRGDVQNNSHFVNPKAYGMTREAQKDQIRFCDLIFSPYNCVLRHSEIRNCRHVPGIGGDRIFQSCAEQIVKYEGYDKVVEYLTAMKEYYPTMADFALRRFTGLGLVENV